MASQEQQQLQNPRDLDLTKLLDEWRKHTTALPSCSLPTVPPTAAPTDFLGPSPACTALKSYEQQYPQTTLQNGYGSTLRHKFGKGSSGGGSSLLGFKPRFSSTGSVLDPNKPLSSSTAGGSSSAVVSRRASLFSSSLGGSRPGTHNGVIGAPSPLMQDSKAVGKVPSASSTPQFEVPAVQDSKVASELPPVNPTQQYQSPYDWEDDSSWSDGTFGSDWEIDPELETDFHSNKPSAAVQANIRQLDMLMDTVTTNRTTQTGAGSYDSDAGWDTEPCEISPGAAGLESWDSQGEEEKEPDWTDDKEGRWDTAEMLLQKSSVFERYEGTTAAKKPSFLEQPPRNLYSTAEEPSKGAAWQNYETVYREYCTTHGAPPRTFFGKEPQPSTLSATALGPFDPAHADSLDELLNRMEAWGHKLQQEAIALQNGETFYGLACADNPFSSNNEKPVVVNATPGGKAQHTDSKKQNKTAVLPQKIQDMPLGVLLDNFSGHLGNMEAHVQGVIDEAVAFRNYEGAYGPAPGAT